jgi:hypothetical protein
MKHVLVLPLQLQCSLFLASWGIGGRVLGACGGDVGDAWAGADAAPGAPA